MVNRDLIPNLKSSCITIGIKEENDTEPLEIHGTGFFIDPEGNRFDNPMLIQQRRHRLEDDICHKQRNR